MTLKEVYDKYRYHEAYFSQKIKSENRWDKMHAELFFAIKQEIEREKDEKR